MGSSFRLRQHPRVCCQNRLRKSVTAVTRWRVSRKSFLAHSWQPNSATLSVTELAYVPLFFEVDVCEVTYAPSSTNSMA